MIDKITSIGLLVLSGMAIAAFILCGISVVTGNPLPGQTKVIVITTDGQDENKTFREEFADVERMLYED